MVQHTAHTTCQLAWAEPPRLLFLQRYPGSMEVFEQTYEHLQRVKFCHTHVLTPEPCLASTSPAPETISTAEREQDDGTFYTPTNFLSAANTPAHAAAVDVAALTAERDDLAEQLQVLQQQLAGQLALPLGDDNVTLASQARVPEAPSPGSL